MSKALARAGRLKEWPASATGCRLSEVDRSASVDTNAEAIGTTAATPREGSASCDAS